MSVIGIDQRTSTTAYSTFPLSVATTVDVGFQEPWGSGIAIGPNHVLTAGHVSFEPSLTPPAISPQRVVLSSNEDALVSRRIGADPADPPANVANQNFLKGYDANPVLANDIALLTTSTALIPAASAIGLISFLDPDDAAGLTVDLAGYPGDIANGRDLVSAPPGPITGTQANGRMRYEIDTAGGQSGSGVWHVLDGDSDPRVLGVHTHGTGQSALVAALPLIGRDNGGTLITQEVYDGIAAQMAADAGGGLAALAADLPENAIVGSGGDDAVIASWREERVLGGDGDDALAGGGADDRLEGGDGTDQALFSGLIGEYDITITDAATPAFTISDTRAGAPDGVDSLTGIEFATFEFDDTDEFGTAGYGVDDDGDVLFVPLLVDPDDPTKLRDGPLVDPDASKIVITDAGGARIGEASIEIPAFSWDGDVDYTLTLGLQDSGLFNIAYIVDSSGSMSGTNIAETRDAYRSLTQFLIDEGIAEDSNFAVVDFDSSARLFANLTAAQATATVDGLAAGGGTSFGPALTTAEGWFESLGNVGNVTNVAYFLSDGFGTGASPELQLVNEGEAGEAVVDVRAFGIGFGADLASLDLIDSGDATLLTDPADLEAAFAVSGIDRTVIDRIEVKLDGTVIDTLPENALVDGPLGLQVEGSIDGLEVSREAMNEIEFDIVFSDGTPTATLATTITTGQEELVRRSADGTRDVVTLAVFQQDFVGGTETAIVNGNALDNALTVSTSGNVLRGNGGDDLLAVLAGDGNVLDGGDGTDTAVFAGTLASLGGVTRVGQQLVVGNGNTLVDVEFVRFDDALIDLSDLSEVAEVSLAGATISVDEDDAAATIRLTLANPVATDTAIDVATRPGTAISGQDYVATTETVTIAAGEIAVEIAVALTDDDLAEGAERFFVDLSLPGDPVFPGGGKTATAAVEIADDDTFIAITFEEAAGDFAEGTGTPATRTITVERFGDLSGTDSVAVAFAPSGPDPVDGADFAGGALPSGTITFAPGEDVQLFAFEIAPDDVEEPDERFTVTLTPVSGGADVFAEPAAFTIVDDDGADDLIGTEPPTTDEGRLIQGTPGDDDLMGGAGDDTIVAGEGDDTVTAGAGDDEARGQGGGDLLLGGPGDDTLSGNGGDDTVRGEDGDDDLFGNVGNDVLAGFDGDDRLTGNAGRDTMRGGDGDDSLFGGEDGDVVDAGTGDDLVLAGDGDDRVDGRDGDDEVFGGAGDDSLTGGRGEDLLIGNAGNDTIRGNGGDDRLFGIGGDDEIFGGNGADKMFGGEGDDTLDGVTGDDALFGEGGADELRGSFGDDDLYGGADDDLLLGGSGDDRLFGQDGDDDLQGGTGDDSLFAGPGDDTMDGGAGDDFLTAGPGLNRMIGGDGADTFVFDGNDIRGLLPENDRSATIADFDASEGDVLRFRSDFFPPSFDELVFTEIAGIGTEVDFAGQGVILFEGLDPADLPETAFDLPSDGFPAPF
jgi:Ca2+-binding RTX toxin-like protein/uncharacterized protein YegL/V8-like Glu-specific endopeptidase